ncbi:uncharacterized protein LOC131161593 [Malania oleifera]|uniref:uncharacterized protein LOC131161593 n=1 Tax=Malania oleifera TaxID=397392 RepID=UPI0025AE238B|nr:uncharacterized protein LOC131161593 [Malania oleifera]
MASNSDGAHAAPPSQPGLVCCMCGDYGLSRELFRCRVCHFRSQHRYCSNLYPKAESYRVCNWCLIQKQDFVDKTQSSPNSSSSHRHSSEDDVAVAGGKSKKRIMNGNGDNCSNGNHSIGIIHGVSVKGQRGTLQPMHLNGPIKKQRPPDGSSLAGQKRIVTNGCKEEEKLRRTKSEEMPNGNNGVAITKQVFRNKVRRYKLLDEVSS